MKKWLTMILVLCMAAVLAAGCGKKDSDDEEKKPQIKKGDIYEMLEEMGNTKAGDVKLTFDIDIPGTKMSGEVDLSMDSEKGNSGFGLKLKSDLERAKFDISLDDIMVVKDGNLYLNLAGIAKAAGSVAPQVKDMLDTSKLGWLSFPLPDDLPKADTKFQKQLVGTFVGLFQNATKGGSVEGEDGDYTVTISSKEDYARVVTAVRDFIKNDLKGLVNDMTTKGSSFTSIDVNKYVEKLINTYKKDVVEIGKDYGLTEEQVDQYIEMIKGQDLNEQLKKVAEQGQNEASNVLTDEQIDEMVKKVDGLIDQLNASEKEPNADGKVRVFTSDDAYNAEVTFTPKEGAGEGKIIFKLEVAPGTPKLDTPSETMSLKEIADIAAPLMKMGNGGFTKPTPTPTETPEPTPTATPVPTETPEPTEMPEPTETPEPTQAPIDEKVTKYEDGKLTFVTSSGKTLTCDLPGNYKLYSATGMQAQLLDGTNVVAFTYQDFSGYSDSLIDTTMSTMLKSYGEGTKYGDWTLFEYGGANLGLTIYEKQLVIISTNANQDYVKKVIDSIDNFDIK
ncbi:MAG: hypothetical protein K6B39_00545 [Lachnospiraceae bacterium]|nr:hypothetical protein [Lachnospiraceae bacterium]